jgi:predicted nucleic acid-binding protein
VSGVVVDTSIWIDFFAGASVPSLEAALAHGGVVLSPIVVAELVSGARLARDRAAIADLTMQLTLHDTPLDHWIRVGELRRSMKANGMTVSTPDAHVAQCALDRRALLLSRDTIFPKIARHSELRVSRG